ncbi:MAG: C39 family peptidase [Pseudomonadota bacterium]
MQFTLRLGDPQSTIHYPLPIHGGADWESRSAPPNASTGNDKEFVSTTSLQLPEIPPDHIVVPSYCQHASKYQFEFSLATDQALCHLHPFPTPQSYEPPATNAETVTPKIDCWHSKTKISGAKLRLWVTGDRPPTSASHLITITVRPLELNEPFKLQTDACLPSERTTLYSQMQADASIANRICSPTALAMAMSYWAPKPNWQHTVEACYDPYTRAYGAWPLAVMCAAAHERMAAVEAFSDWASAASLLEAGLPFVASIRWKDGELDGAPRQHSAGHLVVVRGSDLNNDKVHVLDPAAASTEEVVREYPAEQFSKAWLGYRGAAYIIGPPQPSHSPH